jgi:hypothetical protein
MNRRLILILSLIILFMTGCGSKYNIKKSVLRDMSIKEVYNVVKEEELVSNKIATIDEDSSFLLTRYCKTEKGGHELSGIRTKYNTLFSSISEIKKYLIKDKKQIKYINISSCYDRFAKVVVISSYNNHRKEFENHFLIKGEEFSNNYKKFKELRTIDIKKEKEERKKKEAILLKKQEEKERIYEQKIKNLQNRKGTHVFYIYENSTFTRPLNDYVRSYAKESHQRDSNLCNYRCTRYNKDDNGYETIQEAFDDGWNFVSKLTNVKDKVGDYCYCSGVKLILKK